MSILRHYKQRFDPDAEFVFRKNRKLGLCGVALCHKGMPVTQEMKDTLGKHKLRNWWDAGLIELATKQESVEQENVDKDHNLGGPAMGPAMKHMGAGWYEVTLEDGTVERVRGKKNAEDFLA